MTPRLFIKLTCLLCLISTEGTSGGLETSLRPVLRGNLIETVLSDSLIKRYGVYFKPYSNTPFSGESLKHFESGPLMRKSRYQDGERHGLELWYHENGQIWRKRPYRYGKKHGLHEWYFKGNQILSRKTWKNGKRHGLHEKFDRTGYLISSKIYKDGKLVVSLFDMSQTD